MTSYALPLDDYRFAFGVVGVQELAALPAFADLSADLVDSILVEAGRFATEVLNPLNRQSDEIGARFKDGEVLTPPGFKDAYDVFRDGGWTGLSSSASSGGQGLPETLAYCISEILAANCMSFLQYTSLTHGAAMALEAHGSDALKRTYLEALVSGRWTGTMCLTESQAGTDLSLIRTKATPTADGAYALNGTKIFISAGEHDLTENIVHLVLARLPGAPPGVRGISLFLAPKYLPDPEGRPGVRNAVVCSSIEHKMGMKGSCACVMNFEDATAWLVGEPHKGLKAMFTMMNAERLLLSAQGQAASEAAYQSAVAYARDRRQGRAPGAADTGQPGDPLIGHPDVRRMLLTMKAHAEGNRALALWVLKELDVAAHHPDPEVRAGADAFVALMTPVVKVWLSDNGFEAANLGVQVFGGHGYIREWGMEQLVRDIRILQLYEGANGIQALDLVARKLPMEGGRLLHRLTAPIATFLKANGDDAAKAEFLAPVRQGLARLERAMQLLETTANDPNAAGAGSVDFLKILAFLAQSFLWAKMAIAAADETNDAYSAAFRQAKLATARFFFARMLPQADAHLTALASGPLSVMALPAALF